MKTSNDPKAYSRACLRILGVLLAFGWMHGGPWVAAKAKSEEAIASAYAKLVDESVKQNDAIRILQLSHEKVSEEHRQHSEILREISIILNRMCEQDRAKNFPTQQPIGES